MSISLAPRKMRPVRGHAPVDGWWYDMPNRIEIFVRGGDGQTYAATISRNELAAYMMRSTPRKATPDKAGTC